MKDILKYAAFLILTIISFYGCQENETSLLEEWVFDVVVSDISAKDAVVTIRHNGKNVDSYQGILIKGEVSDATNAINDWLKENAAQDFSKTAMHQCKKVLRVTGLQPKQTYTYIAFGLDTQSLAECKPCAITFHTLESSINASENPNWKILLEGTQLYNGGYYSAASLDLDDKIDERYFFEFYPVSFRDQYSSESDFLESAFEQYQLQNNPNNDRDTWLDILNSSAKTFYSYLDDGDYVAYAIGATIDGELTGHYAKSATFHVDEYPVLDTYNRLIGNWTLIDATGETCDITIKKGKVNKSVQMWGYGTSKYSVTVMFDQSSAKLTIPSQLVANNAEFLANGDPVIGDLYFKGWYINTAGKMAFTTTVDFDIARGSYYEEYDCYKLVPGFIVTSGNTEFETTRGMTLKLSTADSNLYISGTKLEFPIVMQKMTD